MREFLKIISAACSGGTGVVIAILLLDLKLDWSYVWWLGGWSLLTTLLKSVLFPKRIVKKMDVSSQYIKMCEEAKWIQD